MTTTPRLREETPGDGYEIIENEDGRFAIVRVGRMFTVCVWNPFHENWTRGNRDEGGAVHRSLVTLANDNIGGGPILMTLTEARRVVNDLD